MSVMSIDGTALPEPAYTGYKTIREELYNAGRDVQGNLWMSRITTKYQITVEWHAISASEKNTILARTSGDSNDGAFNLTFLSTFDDTIKSGSFYRGTMSAEDLVPYGPFDGTTFRYYDLKLTLIQL